MKPKKVKTAPEKAKTAAISNRRSITKTPIAASTSPVRIAPDPKISSPW
jgi:hypothetical protein